MATTDEAVLPPINIRKAMLEQKINQAQQTYYSMLIEQTTLGVQNPGTTEVQKANYARQKEDLATQLANHKTIVLKLQELLIALPSEQSETETVVE